jgi:hypothetical protein
MEMPPLDPARGLIVAEKLRSLGVKKRILIKAAEHGYITEMKCAMRVCFCPEELGGREHFVARTPGWHDWEPTLEHSPRPRHQGGRDRVDNSLLAHRLCNKLDHFESAGLSMQKDLARVEKARAAAAEKAQPPAT